MTENYSSTLRCACVDCDRPYFQFREIKPGRTVPLCSGHVYRWNTHRVLGGPLKTKSKRVVCTFPECTATAKPNRQRCPEHSSKVILKGRPAALAMVPNLCEIAGCRRPAHSRYKHQGLVYCRAHWQRASRNNGDPLADVALEQPVIVSKLSAAAIPGVPGMGHMGSLGASPPPPPLPSVQTDWAE